MTSSASTPTSTDFAAIVAQLAAREERISLLEEEIRWLKKQLFARSSEKQAGEDFAPNQARLFNEIEATVAAISEAKTIRIPAYDRRKRGRKKLAAHLPRVEIMHDVAESQKICPLDGTRLERIGEEISEQLEFIPARVQVLRHIRPKYACPCCRKGVVQIAPVPVSIFPKSIATASLLAHITTAKFVDGAPLYRQEPQFGRIGIALGRGTMAIWMIRLGATLIVPLINLLNELLLEQSLIHCDETRLQVLKSDKAPTADHWMWVRCAGPPGRRIVLFDYDPSRGGAVPLRLLQGFKGTLLTDGYSAYDVVAELLGLTHAGCMAHAHRYFDEAGKVSADPTHAKSALAFIGRLSLIERALWEQPITADERLAVRGHQSAPIMAEFYAWLDALAPKVLPESRLGKAVQYALGQWRKLSVFLTDGEIPLTNNRCENALRPFVLGRKGWLFSDTVKGAIASANLYSLVETAKANGIEPFAYLSCLFERLPQLKTVNDFEAVLPWNIQLPAAL